MKKIYVVGSSNTDMVVRCDRLPKPGETVLGGRFIIVRGGKGANQAVAAARLGGDVTFLCRVGNDTFGKESLAAYKREGINTEPIIVDGSAPSGVALIVVDKKGENYITVAPGVNANVSPDDLKWLENVLKPGDAVMLQLEIPLKTVERAAAIGREKGALVVLDPAPAPDDGLPDSLYSNLDFILPNESEAAALVGTKTIPEMMAQSIKQKGVKNAIVTAGAKGCVLVNSAGIRRFDACPVKSADSTAAGDAFAGGLVIALVGGAGVNDAIKFAQQSAAISVTRMGAQTSLPTREEVEKRFG